ncbi:MAG TPA: antibiotic biosynthesis monooxygenase family protein, partial [Draconibacterium sp.]|nr:antibiotic biosynthesis monooxygenase family protein [Draconibacterium sp.]
MKNLILSILALVAIGFFTSGLKNSSSENECSYHKDSMNVVMRFEIKVKPEYVSFLKQSFDECRTKVLEQEPGCLDYSLFQSYNDSTLFCLTEA